MDIVKTSVITCPECGQQSQAEMPTDSCQFFYRCSNCETVLRPLEGDCCVYCSYGSVPCPPIQMSDDCCSSPGNANIAHSE